MAIDYTLHQGETIDQYNARIAAARAATGGTTTVSNSTTSTAVNPATGKTNQQVLDESTKVAQQAAAMIGTTYTPPYTTPSSTTDLTSGTANPPTTPTPTAPSVLDAYTQSASANLEAQRKQLEEAYQKQLDASKAQAEATQAKYDALISKQEGVIAEAQTYTEPFRAELETSERERLQIEENYFENQNLVNELEGLLTDIQTSLQQEKDVTGLSAIRTPRIAQATEQATARVGVIEAVMAARNNQITVAENLIDRTVNAMNADRTDKLNYFNTLLDFYGSQADTENQKLIQLTSDQKEAVQAQIKLLETDYSTAVANAEYIKQLMVDPATASAMARAGVTLNDTPEQINAKLSQDAYNQEKISITNSMVANGYTAMTKEQAALKPSSEVVVVTDSTGKESYYWQQAKADYSSVKSVGGGLVDLNTGEWIIEPKESVRMIGGVPYILDEATGTYIPISLETGTPTATDEEIKRTLKVIAETKFNDKGEEITKKQQLADMRSLLAAYGKDPDKFIKSSLFGWSLIE